MTETPPSQKKIASHGRAPGFPVSSAYIVLGWFIVPVIILVMAWLLPIINFLRHWWAGLRW